MSLRNHKRIGAALVCALALTAAACGEDGGGPSAPVEDVNKGGVLRLAHLNDLSHYDTNQAYEVRAWGYHLRATARLLMHYETTTDPKKRDVPVPDLATDDPDISEDGLTYTFTLKKGVKFAPPISREVTAADIERGIKRLCDPNGVSGGLSYYEATIKGMTEYCGSFAKIKKENAAAAKDYVEGNKVEGIKVEGNKITFTLKQKAGDFINMLALPFTAPVPVEALDHITDSAKFRENMQGFSSGPYMISTYTPKQKLILTRNPNWDAKTDPLRKAYVDSVEITLNVSSRESIQQQIEAGTLDGYLRGVPPNAAAQKAEQTGDKRMKVEKDGSCVFYIAFNLHHSTPGGKAIKNKVVRQALNYAIDKTAILQVQGGSRNGEPTGQILGKTLVGYKKIDPYATPGSAGDLTKAKSMLESAGYKSGLKLDMIYTNNELNKNIVGVVTDQLKKIGVAVNGVPKDDATVDTTNPKSDNWDMYYAGWCPDWNGNGARTFFTPLLSDPGLKNYNAGGSYNYGGYDNPAVDKKVDLALAASPEEAANIWADIDASVMQDAPWVPIYTSNGVTFVSSRVKNYVYFPFAIGMDITNVGVQ